MANAMPRGGAAVPRKRRKVDHRRIRATITYTVPELAKRLDVATGTVRSWIRTGLPVIDGDRPKLVHGATLKDWLDRRKAGRSRRCATGEMYCLRCRSPRQHMPGSLVIIQRNAKTAMMSALCTECGARMNRAASVADAIDAAQHMRQRK